MFLLYREEAMKQIVILATLSEVVKPHPSFYSALYGIYCSCPTACSNTLHHWDAERGIGSCLVPTLIPVSILNVISVPI
jgi:hypothetical protein